MVEVEITRSVSNGGIITYLSEGHANYDGHGKDIVCAGVSAVTFGTANAIEALLGIEPEHTIDEGFLKIDLPKQIEAKTFEQVQLLLESMVVMLKSIEESYGEFLTIKEKIK